MDELSQARAVCLAGRSLAVLPPALAAVRLLNASSNRLEALSLRHMPHAIAIDASDNRIEQLELGSASLISLR